MLLIPEVSPFCIEISFLILLLFTQRYSLKVFFGYQNSMLCRVSMQEAGSRGAAGGAFVL